MLIRRAKPRDLPSLQQLETDCFEPERREESVYWQKALQKPNSEVWVATEPSSPVILGSMFIVQVGRTLRIESLAIDPSHQGKGLGQKLLAKATHRARSRLCRRVALEAAVTPGHLIAWYERLGFRKERNLPNYYGTGKDACRLSQLISP
jgi:ribosomal-protein-alanine N-acetyltransferase